MWMIERNGKYLFRESYIDPLTEKKRTVSITMKSKSRASQKQAKIILSDKINKRLSKIDGSNIISGKNAETCIQEWLAEYQQLVKKLKKQLAKLQQYYADYDSIILE